MLKLVTSACMEWLDNKPNGSIVYASYGTFVKLEPKQMEEVSQSLRWSNAYFLMVVWESKQAKLPQKFKEEIAEKGLQCDGVPSWMFQSIGQQDASSPMVVRTPSWRHSTWEFQWWLPLYGLINPPTSSLLKILGDRINGSSR